MRSYITVFNKQKHTEQTTLIATVLRSYGDDVVVNMLEAAKKVQVRPRTPESRVRAHEALDANGAGRRVHGAEAQHGRGEDVQLCAAQRVGNIVDEFNTLNPDKKTNLIAAITKNYGDAGAVTLLEAAKKVPASAVTATRLQREQLKYWLSIRKNQVKCSERSSSTRRETSSWRALSSACG